MTLVKCKLCEQRKEDTQMHFWPLGFGRWVCVACVPCQHDACKRCRS